jgi:hypothetical protein
MYKYLDDCKKCEDHKGMDGTFVRCGMLKEFTTMSPSMPANCINGFKNGDPVIDCFKEDHV